MSAERGADAGCPAGERYPRHQCASSRQNARVTGPFRAVSVVGHLTRYTAGLRICALLGALGRLGAVFGPFSAAQRASCGAASPVGSRSRPGWRAAHPGPVVRRPAQPLADEIRRAGALLAEGLLP